MIQPIDVFMVVHRNYNLADMQIEHWRNHLPGNFRLRIIDNTPAWEARAHLGPQEGVYSWTRHAPSGGFDGVSHGESLDLAMDMAETDIVGMVDTDFFWLNPNLYDMVLHYINDIEADCIGASAFYKDWVNNIDAFYPDRLSSLAPACWGQFMTRELAQKFSFVCTPEEGSQMLYTGWRLRQHLIEKQVPTIVFQGFFPYSNDDQTCAFGTPDKPQGLHFLKGSAARAHMADYLLPTYIKEGIDKWQKKT